MSSPNVKITSSHVVRLGELAEKLCVSEYAFCMAIGLPQNTLGNWKKRGTVPKIGVFERVLNAFPDVNAVWLLTGDGEMFSAPIGGGNFVPKQILDVMGELVSDKKALKTENLKLREDLKNMAPDEKAAESNP